MTATAPTPPATAIAPHDLARFDETLRQLRLLTLTTSNLVIGDLVI